MNPIRMTDEKPPAAGAGDCDAITAPLCGGARQILDAARRLFAEHSYEGVSVHDIAAAAGVSKANVFHHFTSKEALYLTTLREAALQTAAEVESLVAGPGDHAGKLRALAGLILDKMLQDPQQTRLLLRELLEHGTERGRELAQQVFERNFQAEVSLFRQAQHCGAFRGDVDPVIGWLAMIAANMTFFLCRDVLRHNPDFNYADKPEAFLSAVCDVLLHGLAAPASAAPGRSREPVS
ncbi:MAG: TetR/AcrR family transcriptional regulator [Gammaproteobacteria bacterium]|nr:TetR/AcrR family transcriptional regulator [Gammaproteobacteria bacterium]